MLEVGVFAVCITSATLLTLCRVVPYKRVLGLASLVDGVFSLSLLGLFAGTLTGIMSAVVAGLLLAVVLSAGRYFLGYEKLTRYGWVEVPSRVRKPSFRVPRIHKDWSVD